MHKTSQIAHNCLEITVVKFRNRLRSETAKTNWCSTMTKFQFCGWKTKNVSPPTRHISVYNK